MRSITSKQNALVKEMRHSISQGEPTDDGYFAIEGVRMVEEALKSELRFRAVVVAESAADKFSQLLERVPAPVERISMPDEILRSAVETETPQGIAAMVKLRDFTLDHVLESRDAKQLAPLIVVLAGVQDPGNLGTILRSAEALGANGILLGDKTVSQYNAKAVRASAGSLFRLPVVRCKLKDAMPQMREYGVRFLATTSHDASPCDQADLTGPVAIFMGNEGAGLAKEILAQCDESITIPQSANVESLNAGIAASILLYEAARQRRGTSR